MRGQHLFIRRRDRQLLQQRAVDIVADANAFATTNGTNDYCAVMTNGDVQCAHPNSASGCSLTRTSSGGVECHADYSADSGVVLTGAKSITVGGGNYCALMKTGGVRCWGDNIYGQLGDGTTVSRPSPAMIGTNRDWCAVAASASGSFALKTNGTIWAWGSMGGGNIGLAPPDTLSAFVPTQINGGTNWVAIAADGSQLLALRSDGTLWRSSPARRPATSPAR